VRETDPLALGLLMEKSELGILSASFKGEMVCTVILEMCLSSQAEK